MSIPDQPDRRDISSASFVGMIGWRAPRLPDSSVAKPCVELPKTALPSLDARCISLYTSRERSGRVNFGHLLNWAVCHSCTGHRTALAKALSETGGRTFKHG